MMSMEWSHTHFDGYELLATPSGSPPSIVVLDSSALVLVQKILLPAGDSPPRSLTWQPGGARTGSSSGALSCIVSSGGSVELAIFTPTGVHLSSRVRYSWSCATRVPLSPLHTAPSGKLLLKWSCRGPLVVADQAISVWSNCSLPADATATSFSDDESTGDDDAHHHSREHSAGGPRGTRTRTTAYRNSLRLSRKWVHTGAGKTRFAPAPHFVAIATSPCGRMIATAYKDKDEIVVWLRRNNVPPRGGKPWEIEAGVPGEEREKGSYGEGSWNFQPATVLPHSGPLVQLVWERGPGSQQDYLLTLGENGSAHVWIEHQLQDHLLPPMEQGTTKFIHTATIRSWYGDSLRLKSLEFVRWAYFGSHGRDLVRHDGTAPGSAYHLLHQQEQEADGGGRTYRNDNWVIGCGEDGRRFVWSLKGMPLPDGRTIPEPVEVASLPFSWLVGLSATEMDPSALSVALPQVSAVGYYDTHSVDGAPTELQVAARGAGGTIAVITARVHRSDPNSRFVFRNTRSVVLPIGQAEAHAWPTPCRRGGDARVIAHPNLPLVARLGGKSQRGVRGGAWAVEVHSWVNGGSHLQCIPCKPRGNENGQPGHTAGAEPEGAGEGGNSGDVVALIVSPESSSSGGYPAVTTADAAATPGSVGEMKDVVAPVFSELAQKVRSGDELSFVPYALPSLTLGSSSCRGEGGVGGGKDKPSDGARMSFGAGEGKDPSDAQTPLSDSSDEEDIKHAMWMSDWIGTEALPPALAVVDSKSRLHVFELEDGASSEGADAAAAAMSGEAEFVGPFSSLSSGDPQHLRAEWQGKRGSTSGKTFAIGGSGSVMSLSNSNRSLKFKGMMMEDFHEPGGSTPERSSRRARGESRGANIDEGVLPAEKTVVLPLDNKYGLGLTLAFENNQVEVATFVKHPDTNEMLPAEASGRIRPGDELVDINGHSVEALNIEEAMSLIRHARRETMERGSVSLELTFREYTPPPGSARARPDPRSPKPRTGWYPRRLKRKSVGGVGGGKGGGEKRGSAKGSSAAGWANTDAEQHALRWQSMGSSEVPSFKTCTLIPWFGGGAAAAFAEAGHGGTAEISGLTPDHSDSEDLLYLDDGPWAEIGVYPPGDPRRRREALLLGFQPAQASSSLKGSGSDNNTEGYVVALLVEIGTEGGVSVTEVCRTILEAGHEPVSFNREKVPPGAPTNSRASVEAACTDGLVRRWCVACTSILSSDSGSGASGTEERNKGPTQFALSRVDICRPFRPSSGDVRDPKTETTMSTTAVLIAVASPTLLAVARSTDEPATPARAPVSSFPDVSTHSQTTAARAAAATEEDPAKDRNIAGKESLALLEVWSCSPTAHPRCPFKKEEVVAMPWLRADQAVEGMCWVSPEAGDERGAAVSGHCLCVSVEGSVTVLARERRQRPLAKLKDVASAHEGMVGSGADDDVGCWTWSPIFRVANPCSLLACRIAGLRDFCQGLMAKYQRNLALSLVRGRRSKIPPTLGTLREAESDVDEAADVNTDADPASARSSSVPLPLLRNELDGLRGGTTREGRRLEDWHPESLVAMWCTSLGAGEHGYSDGGDRGGDRWAKGRERTLSVLRWVARDSGLESGGVLAGTVVPLLAIGGGAGGSTVEFGDGKGDGEDNVDIGLGKLRACLSSYMRDRLKEEEKTPEHEGQPHASSGNMFSSSASSGRRRSTKSPPRGATPASARDVADIASAAGIPRRLLNLSGAELLALSALLDEALGQDVGLPAARAATRTGATGAVSGAARDTAAALFAPAGDRPVTPPSPSSTPLGARLKGSGNTKSLSPPVRVETKESDDFASVFLFARGMRARLCASNRGGGGTLNPGIASSAALTMLLAPSSTQREVLETLCPKGGRVGTGAGSRGISWDDARAMMLPMWIRSVSELQRVTESVADTTFRQDKDLMAAAIFFAVLGRERKLLSLAKADRGFVGQRPLSGQEGDLDTNSGKAQGPSQGQRLEKLLSHDFSSQRGRAVAEKNAFILLRKRQFKAAAAVFLLARPAMLKEALQVILVHVKDLQLALTVVRLAEVRDAGGARGMGSIGSNGIGSFGGGGGGIGSFGGGGGGFGSFGGGVDEGDVEADAGAIYATIGGATRKILRDEFLPTFDGEGDLSKAGQRHGDMVRSRSLASFGTGHSAPRQRDPFMECATLFWLGQSERALRALCRGPAAEHDAYSLDLSVAATPTAPAGATENSIKHTSLSAAGMSMKTGTSASTVATEGSVGLSICNRSIDVATRPFLVSKLAVIHRERKPVPVRNSWGNPGGSLSSPDLSWHSAPSGGGGSTSSDAIGAKAKANTRADNALRAAAVRLTTVEYLARNGMEISALEVLGNAAGKKWAAELADLAMEKEEAAQGGTAAVGRESTGGGANSQRGSVEVLSSSSAKGRKVLKKTVSFEQSNTGELSGDMFGGFDGPPQTKPKAAAGSASTMASGELSGDMFGGFDGPPQTKPKASGRSASAMASGELSGDMFGGFDGPPQTKPKASTGSSSAMASGELSGGMFGGFDGPPVQKRVTPAAAAASSAGSAMASGELSGDMFGSFDAPPPRREAKKPAASTANALASGELSGDLFGGFDGPRTSPIMPQQSKSRGRKSLVSNDSVASGELSSDLFAAFDGPASSGLRVSSSQKTPISPTPSAIWTPGSSRHGLASPNNGGDRLSFGGNSVKSYGYREREEPSWEAYDAFVAEDHDQAGGVVDNGADKSPPKPSNANADNDAPEPQWFALWAEDLAYEAATKRLLREVRHLLGGLDALAPTSSNMAFALNSLGTATALLGHNGNKDQAALLKGVRATVAALCLAHGLSPRALTAAAAGSLCHASAGGSRRLGALCLLLHALGRSVAADAVVCAAAGRLMQCCSAHGQAHLEDLSVRAAHAKALGTEAEAAKKEARETALSEAVGGGAQAVTEQRARPAGSFITAAVAKATAERKVAEARVAEEAAAAAAGGMGLENLRPHLSELRAAAFQLELCLALHARGCLRLSSRARAEAAVGFRAGLLVEALGRRYDVTEALVGHPPAPMELDLSAGQSGGDERKVSDTPNADLLDALSRLPNPEFETLGLEPWESTLGGRSRPPSIEKRRKPSARSRSRSRSPVPNAPREEARIHGRSGPVGGYGQEGELVAADPLLGPDEERLHLARLTESLSRGVWPTYARLACALNLLSLRAIHGQLCVSLARLIWRPSYRARAPLSSRVCGAVPFHPASEEGEALGTELSAHQEPWRSGRGTAGTGRKGGRRTTASLGSSSLTFYSAFLHPIYIWAQCLDRQFYSQAYRPRVAPSHHLVPRRRARAASVKSVATARATSAGGENTTVGATAGFAASASAVFAPASGVWDDSAKPPPVKTYESRLFSPGEHRRECCPYLFQRAMLVSEDGVRGGRDHLRSDETWSEEDSEERVAYQMLHGMRRSGGSVLPSVALHAVRVGAGHAGDVHFVEAFYSSDARTWLLRAGVDPAGPSAGGRLRRWESLGIAQRVTKAAGGGGHIHFRGERHKGDILLRFVDRWEAEHCDESGGGALRGGPLGRMSYQPVPVGRSTVSLETLYGKLLHAIGEHAALELWKRLAVEDWLVRTISRAEFPFSYRHQLAEFSSASSGEVTTAKVNGPDLLTQTAAAADLPFLLHDGTRRERDAFCLCVFEHLCRNALFRRLRLPHRFQALVTVQLLRLKNLSPNYHPSKTEVFAAVTLKRADPASSTASSADGHGGGNGHLLGDSALKRRGRNTSVTGAKALLPTANGQATQESRWGAKAAFRFPLPEEASPYVLTHGDSAYELVMGGGGDSGSGAGMGSQGPPRCVRIAVWRKQFLSDQKLGEVEVPLGKLNDRVDVDEWVALRGDKGSYWFVNVRFSLRFVMVSVSDPIPEDEDEEDEGDAPESPGITLSHALEDVDVM